MEYSYSGILLSNRKEQVIVTPNNKIESQKYYAEWKKIAITEFILYVSVYIKF